MDDNGLPEPPRGDEHLVWEPGNPVPKCRDCGQPMRQKRHEGAGVMIWRCANPECWLSR